MAAAAFAPAAAAAPAIRVEPASLDFRVVTLGDTAYASLVIANDGDDTLRVSAIEVAPDMAVSPRAPFDLVPGRGIDVQLELAPLDTLVSSREVVVRSDDPARPAVTVPATADVRPIRVETIALTTAASYPLGEAIVVQTVPLDGARIESVTLFHRSGLIDRFQPIEMTFNGRTFIGIIPGAVVMEGGVEFYVVAGNSGYEVSDPPAGEGRPYRVDVERPHEFQLDAVVRNPGFTWRVGETVDFLLRLQRGTVFVDGALHYRRGGDTTFQVAPILDISFTGIAASIPGKFVTERGVEYWAELQTLTGSLRLPSSAPADRIEIRVQVDRLEEEIATPGERYRLLSIPVVMPPATPLPALLAEEAEFGAYDPRRWRAFRWLPERGANVEFSPAEADRFAVVPGRAFWLASRVPHRVDTGPIPGVSPPLLEGVEVILAPGWNAIGNPYPFPISWAAARRPPPVGRPIVFDSELSDYLPEPVVLLEPFTGYFVENISAESQPLLFRARIDSAATAVAEGAEDAAGLEIEALAAGGRDGGNRVGWAAAARPGRDALDAGEPPAPPAAPVRLAVDNRGWREQPGLYRRDLRPPAGAGETWELELLAAAPGPVELVLRPFGAGRDIAWRLIDREQGSVIDLPAAAQHRVRLLAAGPGRPYRLALAGGAPAWVRDAAPAAAPGRLALDPPAPQPARGAARLRFALPRAGRARLEILDLAGRRVATLIDATLPAGFHARVWDATGDEGRPAPSGVYFARLVAGGETRVARLALVR